MRLVPSAVALAATLAACTSAPPRAQPPIPPPPAGHILLATDVTDGHPWKAYRYKGEGGACITIVDEADRQSGGACGNHESAFHFVKTTVWIVPVPKDAQKVRLEFLSKPPVSAQALRLGTAWPYDYAVLTFPETDYPTAIVELDVSGKELRRSPCDETAGCRRG